tara:strand:- start:73 stop:1146 length:1074 start_codon:yes stop_codon:yes gene_type:complete
MKKTNLAIVAFAATALTACGLQGTDSEEEKQPRTETQAQTSQPEGYDDPREAGKAEARLVDGKVELKLPDGVTAEMMGDRTGKMLAVQVMLDHTAHAPGVIDGFGGGNTDSAIRYYREANGMSADGGVDEELLQALFEETSGDVFRTYTVTEKDAKGPFEPLPEEFADMAEMDALGYESPAEMLAERFHMDKEFLEALNPDADFGKAGTKLVIVSHGNEKVPGDIAKLEVRKGEGRLVAFDDAGDMLASFPASIGSVEFPSPSGTMKVNTVAPEPNYTFDGDRQDWGPDGTFILPPGPNNPVGGTWIDLTKDGYGIHGTPDPDFIAKGESHGCVRLTNWNAAALAKVIEKGTQVVFT